jgi:hypothetical protein
MTTVPRAGVVTAATAATVCGLALAVAVANAADPNWTRDVGLDIWHLPALEADARDAEREHERLQEQFDDLCKEVEAIDGLAARLAAGSLSLEAAGEQIEPILRDRPGFEDAAHRYYGAPTLRLAAARYMIARVQWYVGADPCRKAAVTERLEAEYAAMR